MTLLNPTALYLALLAGWILLLALLRTKERRREVAALFLWERLREDPRTKAARRRIPIDLLLVLQIAALVALVLALAGPAVRTRTPTLAELAIVLDGSASMRTTIEGGTTRYDEAIGNAEGLILEHPGPRAAIIQLSSRSVVLSDREDSRADARAALARSTPTSFADGSVADLLGVLESVGGASSFERVVYLSDRPLPEPPEWLETRLFSGGRNWSIDAFSARENPTGPGVLVFLRVSNHTSESVEVTVRVDDGLTDVSLTVPLQPEASETYVLPFPTTRGTAFTATLTPDDGFPDDNVRYFALQRAIDLRVHWIGTPSRYLLAAVEAAVPVVGVGADEGADLTVVYGESVPDSIGGNVLVIHGEMSGIVRIGPEAVGGGVIALQPDHPLLVGVRPENLRIASVPSIESIADGAVVLAAEETPLLVEFDREDRTITFLAADLVSTNLPITVDFPILVANIVARLVRLPAPLSHSWTVVGEPVPLGEAEERIASVIHPTGAEVELAEDQLTFLPTAPGQYRLTSDRGTYPLGVNVSPTESATVEPSLPPSSSEAADGGAARAVLRPFWRALAGIAVLLLLLEAIVHAGVVLIPRKVR